MSRVLKQSKTITGSTSSSLWTWKQVISEYFEEDSSKSDYYIDSNGSYIVVTSYLGRGSSGSYFGGTANLNITCDGDSRTSSKTFSYPTNVGAYDWVETKSETFYVKHESDGKKTISVSSSMSTSDFTPNSASASGDIELTTIPRASEVACSSPYIGDNAIISIDKKSSAFTNTVTYKIGTLTGTVATKTSSTTLQLNTSAIADQIYALIPNDKEIQGTIYCTTYNGSTQIGDTKSTPFNLYAKESACKPDVSATIVDTNTSVTNITDKFIKYISKPKVTINATAKKSARITNYSINLNDGQTSNLQENTFDTIGSNKVTVSVTDSRKYTNSKDYPLDMIDYIKLHIDTISITRPEGTSNEAILNCNGAYFNGSFTNTVSNTLSASFKYRKSGATEWTDGGSITPTIENNTFKFTDLSLGDLFDYNEEYQFKIILQDKFMTVGDSDSDIITLPKGQEVMAIGEDGGWLYGKWNLNDKDLDEYLNKKEMTVLSGTGNKWRRICNIKFTAHNQGEFVRLKIYIGDGNNGEPSQNAYIDLFGQLGWTGSFGGRMGVTAELHPFYTGFTISNTHVKVIANSNIDYDVWFKTDNSYYCRPNVVGSDSNNVTLDYSNLSQDDEPTGTECNLSYKTYQPSILGKMIRLERSSEQSLTAQTETIISWQTEKTNNTNGLLTKDGNYVKIGKEVNYVLVNAQYQVKSFGDIYIYIGVLKANGETSHISNLYQNGQSIQVTQPVSVEEGDKIYISAYSAESNIILTYGGWCNFNVTILG